MNKLEKTLWNQKGADWYLDNQNNPTDKYIDSKISDFEFSFINSPKEVLEIGVGNGRDINKFINLGSKVSGLDISKRFIDYVASKYKGNFKVGDVRDVVSIFKENKFDLVYSRWSLVHLTLKDFKKFLNDIHKLLKSNGKVLVSLRGGNNYEAKNHTTNIQSLQLNEEKVKELLPSSLKIIETHLKPYQSTGDMLDHQFTFILQKIPIKVNKGKLE